MAYGGLRGAVGFSLAEIIPSNNPLQRAFLTCTLVVIFFTVFIQGGTIKVLVNKLKIKRKAVKDKSVGGMVNNKTIDHVMFGVESITGRISRYTLLDAIRHFDENYVKIWLIKKGTVHQIEKKLQDITLEEHYARLYGPTVLVSSADKSTFWRPSQEEKEETNNENVAETNYPPPILKRKDLMKAFSTNPYEKYHNKLRRDSVDDQLEDQLNRRWQNASLIGRRLMKDIEDDNSTQNRVKNKWQGAASKTLTTALIKKQYSDAKDKFKGNSLTRQMSFHERENMDNVDDDDKEEENQ